VATATRETIPGRRWADLLAIVTGVALLAIAIWPGEPTGSGGAATEFNQPRAAWLAHVLAGAMAILAVFMAQAPHRRMLARALLIFAGLLLLVTLVLTGGFGVRGLLSLGLPAAALLAAAFGVGPLTRPVTRRG
jgi:cytochrome bd-type quinol oxidase subunit 2